MNRIDDILDSLQGRQPVLTDSEELAASIMANLDSPPALPAREGAVTLKSMHKNKSQTTLSPTQDKLLPPSQGGQGVGLFGMAARTVTALAAAWLVGLLIYQQYTDGRALQGSVPYVAEASQGSTLRNVYEHHLMRQRQTILSYTFVKQQLNENH